MDFFCTENVNGSYEIYNTAVGDIYYSNIGAYNEAMQKFVLPSKILDFSKQKLKILDACYGMGFNSKSLVDFCFKNNCCFDLEIDCIEIDKNILALGLFIFDENITQETHICFGNKILEQCKVDRNIMFILGENGIKKILDDFLNKFCPKKDFICDYLYKKDITKALLHNIYYQNHNYNNQKIKNLKINFYVDDLVKTSLKLDGQYQLIFHDAFSILKQPELWSESLFKRYYDLLEIEGKILTYSNSRVLRRTMEQVGFEVQINKTENGKQNGTIGIKT